MAAAEVKCQIYDFHIPKVLLKICFYYVPNLVLVFHHQINNCVIITPICLTTILDHNKSEALIIDMTKTA